MNTIKLLMVNILLLNSSITYASSDDFFPGKGDNDPIRSKLEKAERQRKQQKEEEKKVSEVIRLPGEESTATPEPSSTSSSNDSARITMPAADIPVLDTCITNEPVLGNRATNASPEQEFITEPSEILVIGVFMHDLRSAAAILITILDCDIADIRSATNHHAPEHGNVRDLMNRAEPRIIPTLVDTIMVRIDRIQQQLSERRTSRPELAALLRSLADWIRLVKASSIPTIGVLIESIVDLERLTDDFSVYQTRHDVLTLTPTRVRIRELVERISRMPFSQRRSEVDFRAVIEDNVPAEIIADATRLRQVIINLLYNAFKFTRVGHVTLSVSMSPNGRSLLFSVQDTGAGIAPEGIARLFEPFVQGPAGQAARTGLGLGLAIVKRLVEAFGGEIKVESTEGKGSTFFFFIPFVAD